MDVHCAESAAGVVTQCVRVETCMLAVVWVPVVKRSEDMYFCLCFFFNDTATTEIYTLSLHDALPIWAVPHKSARATPADCSSSGPNPVPGVLGRSFQNPSSKARIRGRDPPACFAAGNSPKIRKK